MLSKNNRFSLTDNYQRLKEKGRWHNYSYFDLLYSSSDKGKEPKIAIVVANKVSLKATTRHKTKRQIAEAIRSEITRLPKNLELAIFVKKPILGIRFGEIKSEIEKALIQVI